MCNMHTEWQTGEANKEQKMHKQRCWEKYIWFHFAGCAK